MSFVPIVLFWTSVAAIFYAYVGYPLLLMILPEHKSADSRNSDSRPKVTLIITAYNEVDKIEDKLRNALGLDYPSELLEIIVASDASSDGTDEKVRSFQTKGIRLVRLKERKGKEFCSIRSDSGGKRGDLSSFSDASTLLRRDTIQQIVLAFNEPKIGAVSSEDTFVSDDPKKQEGEGIYVRYEMWLRKLESQVGSLVGLSGSLFAIRREIGNDFPGDVQSDFHLALKSVSMGYRAVSNPAVKGYYKDIKNETKEFDRKVRTVVRGLTVFFRNLTFLNPLKYGFFSLPIFQSQDDAVVGPVFF